MYLTRPRVAEHGPHREGEVALQTSDDLLARISLMSLARPVSQTDHSTEFERRRILLDMDLTLQYNKKLIAVFQDVVDHIGPNTVATPTEWEFAAAQQFLARKKLECEKWQRLAAVKAADHERKDLFLYYNAVKQHIHNTARDIAHQSKYTAEQLRDFVETVRGADKDLIESWFEDAVGPSCRLYVSDLNQKNLQIENLMKAVEKLKVYKSLMSYKDTDQQTMFDDDIYHKIQKLGREVEGLKEGLRYKERKVEVAQKASARIAQHAQEVEKSAEKHNLEAETYEVYVGCLGRNIAVEEDNTKRLQAQTVTLKKEVSADTVVAGGG